MHDLHRKLHRLETFFERFVSLVNVRSFLRLVSFVCFLNLNKTSLEKKSHKKGLGPRVAQEPVEGWDRAEQGVVVEGKV